MLKKYMAHAQDAGRIAISYTDKSTVLNQLELTEEDKLLNAEKVLFSDDLLQDVQMAIFATNERLTFNDIQRYHGPVLKLVDIAENYIKSNIHWRVERPVRRNPKIARILYYSKDIENFGTGLKRIADACENAGVRYEFQKKKTGFVVCFYRSKDKDDIESAKKPIKADRQERIVEYVKIHGMINNKEARDLLGLADSTTKRILKEMVKENVLTVEGERKTTKYLLKK